MNKIIPIAIVCALLIGSFLYFALQSNIDFGPQTSYLAQEKIAVTKAFTNETNDAVFLEVVALTEDVAIDQVIIKDTKANTVTYGDAIPQTIVKGETEILRFYPHDIIATGYYTATAISTKGGSFVSESSLLSTSSVNKEQADKYSSPQHQYSQLFKNTVKQVSIQNVLVGSDGRFISIYAQSTTNNSLACNDAILRDYSGSILVETVNITGGPIRTEMTNLTLKWEDSAISLKPKTSYIITLLDLEENELCTKTFYVDDSGGLAHPLAFTNGTANAMFVEFRANRNLTVSEFKIRTTVNGRDFIVSTLEMPLELNENEAKTIRFDIQTPLASGRYLASFRVSDAGFFVIILLDIR